MVSHNEILPLMSASTPEDHSTEDHPPEDHGRLDAAIDAEPMAATAEDLGSEVESACESREILPFFHAALGPWPKLSVHKTRIDRQAFEERSLGRQADRREAIVTKLQLQLDANREAGSNPIYAGFEFVPTDETPSVDEAPYVGTFLPLEVAARFPELLLNTTITYDDIYCRDVLAGGTRIVVSPGVFRTLRRNWYRELLESAAACSRNLLALATGRRHDLASSQGQSPRQSECFSAGDFRTGQRRGSW